MNNMMRQQERTVEFVRMGFHHAESEKACHEIQNFAGSSGAEHVATLRVLLSCLEEEVMKDSLPSSSTVGALHASELSYLKEERDMEVQALEVIYQGSFAVTVEDQYIVTVKPNESLKGPARSEKCKLHVFLRPGYPVFSVPLFLFTNPNMSPSLLRRINVALIRKAHEHVGGPLVFAVVDFISNELQGMQAEFIREQQAKEKEKEEMRLMEKIDAQLVKQRVEQRKMNRVSASSATSNTRNQPNSLRTSNGASSDDVIHESKDNDGKGADVNEQEVPFMARLRKIQGATQKEVKNNGYHLSEPQAKSGVSRHVPAPIAVRSGDLVNVMKDVTKVQAEQPWLISSEARAMDCEPEPLTPVQLKKREQLSSSLRNDLEQKDRSAKEWGKQNPGFDHSRGGGKKSSTTTQSPQQLHKMMSQRQRLPACMMKDEIVKTIGENQITVISGDTGCGKTTQVPQLVLDDMIQKNRGAEINIIVTQPRRISALGVSERVASERCERLGETSGYSIRMESKRSAKTRLLFCTTGILLRRLQCDPDLASVSHIFVDEVHERDLNTDFLLIILKDLLARRKSLKLVLMSATLNADTFSAYFTGAPTVSIPGRTFPVKEHRLEDILQMTGYEIKEGSDYAQKKKKVQVGKVPSVSKAVLKQLYGSKYDSKVVNSLAIVDESVINYELIASLLEHIAYTQGEGAILVFLPGLMEITKAIEELKKKELFADPSRAVVYPLHSSLSTAEQTAVFQVPAPGIRKVIFGTNIAETSITVEDVVFVVDAGRVKENRQDEVNQMQTLVECWVSRASAKQRRGRAGRVRPGMSYHLFSSHTFQHEIQEYQLPEMLRVGLEDLVLQVLLLDLGEPSVFLSKAVNPPSALAMTNSLRLLEGLGAVECEWEDDSAQKKEITAMGKSDFTGPSCVSLKVTSGLTALGFHLATLPVDARVGKMMIYGALFGCVEPALTIAASMSARNPFMSPFDKRDEADAARKEFATAESDHLTTLEAFNQWKEIRRTSGERATQSFLRENFLSRMTLFQMEDLRRQFAENLKDIGFLPKSFHLAGGVGRGRYQYGERDQQPAKTNTTNTNEGNSPLLKAILCAGLYPNVIIAPEQLVQKDGKPSAKEAGACAFQSLKGDVHLHPSTIAFSDKRLDSRYCVYHEMIKTSKTYVRDCTPVSEFALLLFGGVLRVYQTHGVASVDEWLKFRIAAKPATLVKHLRAQMENMLLKKIVSPEEDVTGSPEGRALIQAVGTLLDQQKLEIIGSTAAESVYPKYEQPPVQTNGNSRPANRENNSRQSGSDFGGGRGGCYNCDQVGHLSRDCPQERGGGKGRGRGGRDQGGRGRGGRGRGSR